MYTISTRFQVEALAAEFDEIWKKELARKKPHPNHHRTSSDAPDQVFGDAGVGIDVTDTSDTRDNITASTVQVDTTPSESRPSSWKKWLPESPFPDPDEPSLARALWTQFIKRCWFIGFYKFFGDMANISTPLLLAQIVTFVEQSANSPTPPPVHMGFIYCAILFIFQGISALMQNRFQVNSAGWAMAVRATLTSTIYRKSLRLSALARQEYNVGRVTNMISTDSSRLEQFSSNCYVLVTAPIMLMGIFVVLLIELGPPAIAGFVLLICLTPVQERMWKRLSAIRKQSAGITDQRVRNTQEILSGIRIIKFFAWETPFLERIMSLRNSEMNQIIRASITRAALQSIAFSFPVISAAVSFVIYGLTAPRLDPAKIFAAVSLFSMMRFPLQFLPLIIAAWADSAVAITRITGLLLADEIENQPVRDDSAPNAVHVVSADFIWETEAPELAKKRAAEKKALTTTNHPGRGISRLLGNKPEPSTKPDPASTSVDGMKSSKGGKWWRRKDVVFESAEGRPESPLKPSPLPELEQEHFSLHNINLTIPRGQLVVVVGAVGSGKSSLLNGLVGECKRTSGPDIVFGGSVGYVSQQPWIQASLNATVKENILFGQPYNRERYYRALHSAALEKDIAVFPQGDQTDIGEKGITLSGGQKARVSLARLVYYFPDIVLLDDPISAVDAHVGRFLFEKCIMGALKDTTRILVTHQLHFLHRADYVIVMKKGRIAERGSFSMLMEANGEFADMMRSYGGVEDELPDPSMDVSDMSKHLIAKDYTKIAEETQKQLHLGERYAFERISKQIKLNTQNSPLALMSVEDRAVGSVSGAVYWSYAKAAGGVPFLVTLSIIVLVTQIASVGNNFWLTVWTRNQIPVLGDKGYIGIYLTFGVTQSIMLFTFSSFMAIICNVAARKLHIGSISKVMFAPTNFFDTTPMGRIMNRFARDQDQIDTQLVDSLRQFITTFASAISTFALILYATPIFGSVLLPMLVIYWFIQQVYRKTARELKRLDSITRSPLYAYIGETLTGLSTIRAFSQEGTFVKHNDSLIDTNNCPYYMTISAQYWLSIRLNMMGNVMVFFAAMFGILDRFTVSAAIIGLALSYAQQVTQTLSMCVQQFVNCEIQMNSVERVYYYAHYLEQEAAPINPDHRPPQNWPKAGTIVIKDLQMKYSENGPLILKNISLDIKDGEKIGIVGRTGSGKSSLAQALFRMVEPASGSSIVVDGEDIMTMGLKDLRRGITMIPQDPILFSGTIRYNLDPFNEHSDNALWEALDRASLKPKIAEMDGKLDGAVTEGGENLSVGQRQLLCLARAMLRRPKILVLDEVTSNIDYETDATVQRVLREDFANTTILTIAHRLNTIIDYDRVMLLDFGNVKEFDSPAALLSIEGSAFGALVDETGEHNSKLLRAVAMQPPADRRRSVVETILPNVGIVE
ncbi:hypothetical protein SmJEL517_g06008 [Synchytrium microbalum]|uniref:Uncharacterized protein n=1 Tax=Synchytrium microbalum TaxID=1806994 RepID=A0A507BI37_9FUNG|nr:uncharacterized protein SmJEL517_g06008 [Synchytrium microbalum]TPX30450.1 hypothetical protein SmJEL517_g06008 [Synchytrium microbalum]